MQGEGWDLYETRLNWAMAWLPRLDVYECSNQGGRTTFNDCNEKLTPKLFDLLADEATELNASKKTVRSIDAGLAHKKNLLVKNAHFDEIREAFLGEVIPKIQNTDHIKKVEKELFPLVQESLLRQVDDLPLSISQKSKWKDKIKSIKYAGSKCENEITDKTRSSLKMSLQENGLYFTKENKFYFCSGISAQNPNDAMSLLVIAHELAHAIGPCPDLFVASVEQKTSNWQYPLKNLVSCLRNEGSANAKLDDEKFGFYTGPIQRAYLKSGLIDQKNCWRDQINEMVPDWFASEVVGNILVEKYKDKSKNEFLKAMKNGWSFMCVNSKGSNGSSVGHLFDTHGAWPDRINRILLQNPKIRFLLGCPRGKTQAYCNGRTSRPTDSEFGVVNSEALPAPSKPVRKQVR